MLFPTIDFGLFFAFALGLVWSLNSQNLLKKWVLLALSLAFYASWNWRFLLLLFASGAISYVVGLYVDGADRPRPSRRVLALGRRARSRHPGLFQISRFLHRPGSDARPYARASIRRSSFVNVTLPVAISFLTFHAISYIVDVYRGRLEASRSPLDILLYISFFPHLVAGPIVRAHEFLPQLASPRRAGGFRLRREHAADPRRPVQEDGDRQLSGGAVRRSRSSPIRPSSRASTSSWRSTPTPSRSTPTSPPTPTSPSASRRCSAIAFRRTSTSPIARSASAISGGAGT